MKIKNCIPLSELHSYRVNTFKTRQLGRNDQLQRHKKRTSYMYLDLNGSANSLTHDLPFTKGGPPGEVQHFGAQWWGIDLKWS